MRLPLSFTHLASDLPTGLALLILWGIKLITADRIHTDQWHYCPKSLRLKEDLRKWLIDEHEFTHFVTLNLNRKHTPDRAKRLVKLWYKNVLCRLMKRTCLQLRAPRDVLFFFAFPEDTLQDRPHFHLLVRVTPDRAEYFDRIAAKLWINCSAAGSCDIQRIGPTEEDRERLIFYVTKNTHRYFSSMEYFPSTEFEDAMETPNAKPPLLRGVGK